MADLLELLGDIFASRERVSRKSGEKKKAYDRENSRPILKCSICNGEQVAGFKDIHTGKFEEVMLIRTEKDLQEFMKAYDIQSIEKEY